MAVQRHLGRFLFLSARGAGTDRSPYTPNTRTSATRTRALTRSRGRESVAEHESHPRAIRSAPRSRDAESALSGEPAAAYNLPA